MKPQTPHQEAVNEIHQALCKFTDGKPATVVLDALVWHALLCVFEGFVRKDSALLQTEADVIAAAMQLALGLRIAALSDSAVSQALHQMKIQGMN